MRVDTSRRITDTGKRAGDFTVPGDPKYGFEHPETEMAAKTWDPSSPLGRRPGRYRVGWDGYGLN